MAKVGSLKKTEEIEGNVDQTFFGYLQMKLRGLIISNIPESLEDLPRQYYLKIGFLSLLGMLTCFIYFVWTYYTLAIEAKFISLSKDSGICSTVKKPMDGQILLDSKGNWQGSAAFNPNIASLSYSFNNYLGTEDEFYHFILDIFYQIDDTSVAGAFQQNTLMNNLILFITTRTAVTQTSGKSAQKHMVKFTGDAAYVFNTPTQASLFSSIQGDCIAVPKLDYRVTEVGLRLEKVEGSS